MAKQHPGLFKPKYKDRHGVIQESNIWYLDYECAGCVDHPNGGRHRESSGKTEVRKAQGELDKRRGSAAEGKQHTNENEIRMSKLFQDVLNEARVGRDDQKTSTFKAYEDIVRKHLMPELGAYRAVALCHDSGIITDFVARKKVEEWHRGKKGKTHKGYSNSTINGMLQIIGRGFELNRGLISVRPNTDKLSVDGNQRKVFFTESETQSLLKYLPADLTRPIQVLNLTGWRSWSEIFSRERRHVDWKKNQLILEPGEAKNSESRIFPLRGELLEIIKEQDAATRELEKRKGIFITMLFHDAEGKSFAQYYEKRDCWKPTRDFRKLWDDACKKAGLVGKIRHDFRRTAVRRFDEVKDHVGMKLSGHRSHKIYLDYKATNENDLIEAAEKLFKSRQRHDKDGTSR